MATKQITAKKINAPAQDDTDLALEQLRALGDLLCMAGGSGQQPMEGTLSKIGDMVIYHVDRLDSSLACERAA